MNPIKNAIAKFRGKPKMEHNFIGAPSFAQYNPGYGFLNCYESDAYASIYPSVKAITNEFMTIMPFAIDSNGKPKQNVPAINALYHPNQQDSSVAFFEKLAAMNLTHRKTYVLVWRKEGNTAKPGGEITPDNIAGYTFLERPAITRRDGKTYYNIGSQYFTEDEVIVIPGGVDPNNLYRGYAPGEASRRWAKLDDYIADYQAGFFENGAVPAGQFIITAASKADFDDTVDKLQAAHRGAGKNNNVTYTPRPVDPNTGKPSEAKIEWIPFASSNKDIDFKNLFEQANKRIDSTFGVPASVRGVGENNNYATAQTDRQNFIRLAVSPLALRIYTQITHELNRITNGLGVAITYKLELPAIADEELTKAETKNVEVTALTTLVTQGYSLDTAVDALDLSPRYKLLELSTDSTTNIENDKPDVDDGGEVNKSPDPDKIDGVTPLNKKKDKSASNKLSDLEKLEAVSRRYMKRQIDRAVEEYTEENNTNNQVTGEPTSDEKQDFVDEMLVIIVSIMISKGEMQYAAGIKLLDDAGVSTDNLDTFILSDGAKSAYQGYLSKVGESYGSDTAKVIRSVLANADTQGLTSSETKKALRAIVDTDEWRIKRLADTELNRSQSLSGIESMKQIQNESGATLEKSLQHTGGDEPCEFCRTLINKWFPVDQITIPEDNILFGEDGGMLINKFAPNDGYDPHPNGHCVPQFRVANSFNNQTDNKITDSTEGSVNIKCSDCGRWLGKTDQTLIATIKCSNSKCKKDNNIKVVTNISTDDQMRYIFKEEK